MISERSVNRNAYLRSPRRRGRYCSRTNRANPKSHIHIISYYYSVRLGVKLLNPGRRMGQRPRVFIKWKTTYLRVRAYIMRYYNDRERI